MKALLIFAVVLSVLTGTAVRAADGPVVEDARARNDRSFVTSPFERGLDELRNQIDARLGRALDQRREVSPVNPDPRTPVAPEDALPNLHLEAGVATALGCAGSFQFNATLTNLMRPEDTGAVDATNVQLSFELIEGADHVESVMIAPSFWEVIPAGAQVEFQVDVTLNGNWDPAEGRSPVTIGIFYGPDYTSPRASIAPLVLTVLPSCAVVPDDPAERVVPAAPDNSLEVLRPSE
jgi:hypothetical protein